MIKRSFLASTALALSMTFGAGTASAAPVAVDLQLVLAVDVSGSVDADEFILQRDGYVNAFQSAAIQNAIFGGTLGRIAVTYVYWANASSQQQTVGWTLIDNAASANGFAAAISAATRPFFGATGIGAAINFSAGLFGQTDGDGELLFSSARQLIDISGDGTNNSGVAPNDPRDAFLAGAPGGTTRAINAVAIGAPTLQTYFENNVIGGPGSFALFASNFEGFQQAINDKLLREIQPVSAPATLSLVGLALIGLAMVRRRRSA